MPRYFLRLRIISICRCLFFILDSRQLRTINLPKHSSENNNSGSSPFAVTSQGGQHKRSRCGCLRVCLLTYMANLKRRSVKFKTERDGECTEVAFSLYGIVFVVPTWESSTFWCALCDATKWRFPEQASLTVRKAAAKVRLFSFLLSSVTGWRTGSPSLRTPRGASTRRCLLLNPVSASTAERWEQEAAAPLWSWQEKGKHKSEFQGALLSIKKTKKS